MAEEYVDVFVHEIAINIQNLKIEDSVGHCRILCEIKPKVNGCDCDEISVSIFVETLYDRYDFASLTVRIQHVAGSPKIENGGQSVWRMTLS